MVEVDPASRERLELETRVLAAALRQSLQLGDMEGSNLAHEQIFILLKARQELMNGPSAVELSRALRASEAGLGNANGQALPEKTRRIPDIEWFEEGDKAQKPATEMQSVTADPAEPDKSSQEEISQKEIRQEDSDFEESAQENLALPGSETDKSQLAAVVQVEQELKAGASQEAAEPNFYQFFGLEQGADRQDIHRSFLVRVRSILRGIKQRSEPLRGFERQEVLKGLQKVWINHDILQDASTRGDYDQRLSGHAVSHEAPQESKNGPTVRIGELLQSSGLLEKTELEIAADMHKAMPELMFGSFLVKQGFVEERDLECVLISQQLIKTGQISLEQFQELMPERGDSGTMFNLLLERGLVTREELDKAISSLPSEEAGIVARALAQETQAAAPEAEQIQEVKEVKEVKEVQEAPVKLTPNNAVPSWKDQLDWSEPEAEAAAPSKVEQEVIDTDGAKEEEELLSFSPDEGGSEQKEAEPVGGVFGLEVSSEIAKPNPGEESASRIDLAPEAKTDKEPGQNSQERVRKRSLIDLMFDLNPQESLKESTKESTKDGNADSSLESAVEEINSIQSAEPASVGTAPESQISEPAIEADLALGSADSASVGAVQASHREHNLDDDNLEGQAELSAKEVKRPSLDDVLFGGCFKADTGKADTGKADGKNTNVIIGDATFASADTISHSAEIDGGLAVENSLPDDLLEEANETLESETHQIKNYSEEQSKEQSKELASSFDLAELEPEMDIEKELNDLERLEALDNLDEDGDDLESDTSTELPALENVDKSKAAAKDNWSIVSKPASYLASFLMDEMPARKDKGNTGNTGKKDDDGGRRGFKRKKRN
ncbi:MAG: hypothetical protein J0M35_18045 [Candidatus Obscuribacter phosphatis]|uniref:Uncharacterized protein n=1 Tax=Candidatus Obscuribacter phosphatis TaxID=1906157 RepID=A0A8J7PJ22_9BACT|nr:hypothetical protein [Candidatus Obscuribacter phosphatis]